MVAHKTHLMTLDYAVCSDKGQTVFRLIFGLICRAENNAH